MLINPRLSKNEFLQTRHSHPRAGPRWNSDFTQVLWDAAFITSNSIGRPLDALYFKIVILVC